MDVDEFREQSRKTWDAMAVGWEARDAFLERNMGLVNDWSAPGPFALADPEQIRALLTRAGFSEPEIVAIDFAFHWADGSYPVPAQAWGVLAR